MKKIIFTIFTAALLNLPITAKASTTDEMVEMMVSMFKQSGQMSSLSSCLGLTEKEFIKAYKKTVKICFPQDGLEGNCMETLAPKNFGISKDKLDECSPDDEGDHVSEEDDIDYSELSDEEVALLQEKMRAEGMEKLEAMLAYTKKSSEGTEDKISLPVYSPSTLASNYTSGMKNSKGKVTLPIATFNSEDSVKTVVDFYKKALPDFKIKQSNEIYYVMETPPEDLFKLSMDMENLPLYFIPHIEIYSLKISGKETTFIVISYQSD